MLAQNFERIHRSNLVGMGVLPLEFTEGMTRKSLQLTGEEVIDLDCDLSALKAHSLLELIITDSRGKSRRITVRARLDTPREVAWFAAGGIMPYVLTKTAQKNL